MSSSIAPHGEGFLLIWELGTWAWLCVCVSRGPCVSSLSLPIYTVGIGGSWALFPRQPFPIGFPSHSPSTLSLPPLIALDARPLWLPPCPPSPSPALPGTLLSPLLFLPLSLSRHPPSLPLLSCWALLSPLPPLCLWTPGSSQTWFTFRWLQRYFCPFPAPPPTPRGTHPARASPAPSPVPITLPASWGNQCRRALGTGALPLQLPLTP